MELENSTATTLASHGYRVRQNPAAAEVAQARSDAGDLGRPTSRPDYLIEGRVFDCYAPQATTSVRNVWTEVQKKVTRLQTQRVVVNLEDWRGDMSVLQKQFADWPIENVREVKLVMSDRSVVQLIPKTTDGGAQPDGA